MAQEIYQTVVGGSPDHNIPLISGLDSILRCCVLALDVGYGRERAINKFTKNYPNSKFVEYDLSYEAIKEAPIDTKTTQINNAVFKSKIS